MFSPVDRFRVDLTAVVRRLSRVQSNETSIDEMVSHFEGLYQEERKIETDDTKAERSARKRMGSIYKMAFQIVNSPDRTRKGFMTQGLMFALFAVAIPIFICSVMGVTMYYLRYHSLIRIMIIDSLLCGGFVAGIGMSIAKRIAWKPLVLAIVISVIGSGVMSNKMFYSEPRMTRTQMTDLVRKQADLEPRVAKIEAQVKNILNLRDQSSEAWKKELNALPALVREGNVPFYKETPGTTGAYLFPSQVKYGGDYLVPYSMILGRTENLSIAQNAWNNYQAHFEDRFVDFHSREEAYKLWRDDAANYSMLWMKGFRFSGGVCLRLGAVFSLLALIGYLLGTARVFGFDWLRLSRG